MKNKIAVFGAMVALMAPTQAQTILAGLATPDSLDHFEIGEAAADDYGALPYGKGHVLFLSNRDGNGLSMRDPKTNEPFARPYLLRLKDLKTFPYELPGMLAEQPYYIGLCALLPDSSGIIASHSRTKPYKDGRVGMTLTMVPFNGEKAKELPFIDVNADYQHPYFDPNDYTLYFTSNVDGGQGGYDLYSSTLSFDGAWSTPAPVALANTKDNELFPTVGANFNLYFARATRNYGLQSLMQKAGDSAITELPINGRGDDFGLLILDDSTAIVSQSKRAGSPANLHLYKVAAPIPVAEVEVAVEEAVDSAALAIAKADSIAAYEASQTASAKGDKGTKSWVTDNTPEPGTSAGYSLIVGGFLDRDLAENFLETINGWAPEAFLSRYNGKYYVVHSVHANRDDANKAKGSVNNRDYRAWVLSRGLKSI